MDIGAIEKLVELIRDARISELTVTSGGESVRLKKRPVAQIAEADRSAPEHPHEPEQVAEEVRPTEFYISAPMVGIFHSAGNSVRVGAPVRAGQVVGAIESMKLMNDIVCDVDGIIEEELVEDGMPVEYGQSLLKIRLE